MGKAPDIRERIAEYKLRIIARLYETGREPYDLPFSDVAEFPLDDVDRNEVRLRLETLKEEDWISGVVDGNRFQNARLSAAGVARLQAIIHGAIATTWLQKVRDVLAECDAGERSTDKLLQVHDGIFVRPARPGKRVDSEYADRLTPLCPQRYPEREERTG